MNKIIKGIIFLFLSLLTLLTSAFTTDFVPIGDINGRSIYDIKNFVDINATTFYQNGNQVLDTSSSVSANSSTYWIGASSADSEWFYVFGESLLLNETHLNASFVSTESDPVYIADPAFHIEDTNISNWNIAYSWGDHGSVGYSIKSSNEVISGDKNFTGSILIEEPTADKNPATKEYVDNATPAESQTLQNVTGEGATTTDSIIVNGLKSNDDIDNGGNILTNTSGILFGAAWDGNTTFIGGAGNGSCDGSTCSIANTGTLDGYEGSDFVHKNLNEVISGDKNFTGQIIIDTVNGTNPFIIKKNISDSGEIRLYETFQGVNQGWLYHTGPIMNYRTDSSGSHNFYVGGDYTFGLAGGYVQFDEPLDMNNNRIYDLATPTSADDAIPKEWAEDQFVNISGDTVTGALVILEPTADKNPATKEYVDNITSSLNWSNINGATLPTACPGDTVLIGFNSTDNSAICETDQTGGGSYDLNVTTPSGSGTIEDSEVLTFAESGIIDISMSGNTVTISATSSSTSCPTGTTCVDAGNYTDYKAKLKGASNGDHIYVPAGIYSGAGILMLNKTDVTIEGAGYDQVLVYVTTGDGIDVKNSANVSITGLRLVNPGHGIEFEGVERGYIAFNKIINASGSGIYINGNEDEDSNITDGTWVYSDKENVVYRNIIEDYKANGIETYYNYGTLVEENTVYATFIQCGGAGEYEVGILGYTPDETIFRGNVVGKYRNSSGTLIGVYEDAMQMHCDGHDLFGINCMNNIIEYNELYGGGRCNEAAGLLVNHDMNHTIIRGNNIFDSGCGDDTEMACVQGTAGDGNGFKTSEDTEYNILQGNYVYVSSGKSFNVGVSASTGYAEGNVCYDENDDCFSSVQSGWEYQDNYQMNNASLVYQGS